MKFNTRTATAVKLTVFLLEMQINVIEAKHPKLIQYLMTFNKYVLTVLSCTYCFLKLNTTVFNKYLVRGNRSPQSALLRIHGSAVRRGVAMGTFFSL